jgi:zinc transporter 1/2/3
MEHNISDGDIPHHHEDEHGDEGIVVAKVVAMIVLSLASFILGMLPTKLATWFRWNRVTGGSRSQLVLSLLLCFGGGTLLCTTFLHLLPEVREVIMDLQEEGKIAETSFHLPELIMCCGFFTMYLVEELVHLYLHWHGDTKGVSKLDNVIHRSFSVRKCSGNHGVENDAEDSQRGSEDTSSLRTLQGYPSVLTISTIEDTGKKEKAFETVTSESKTITSHHTHNFNKDVPVVASVRGLLVVLALSIHELFEGLAVGLQTSTSYVWYMLGAVSAHKLVIAFCVGIELVSSRTKFILTLVYISTFALVSPLGIGIGIGLSESNGSVQEGVPNAILQGMASGTLLYVVFFEVLQRERGSKESGLKQLLAIVVGFGIMFGLLIAGKFHSKLFDNMGCSRKD